MAFLATSSSYGSTRSLLTLLDGLRDYNVAAHVICPAQYPVADAVRSRGLPAAVLPLQWWMAPPSRGALRGASKRILRNLACLPALVRQLRDWQIDVVHTNTSVLPIGAVASLMLGRPHVWHVREFGQLDHGLKPDWGNTAHHWWLNRARRIIAVSRSVRASLIGHVDPERINVIYNGVASEAEFDRLHELAHTRTRSDRGFTFALVGKIRPSKGQESAIRALALVAERCPSTRLILVGGGDTADVERCQVVASQLGIRDRVEFRGYIANPWPVYLEADAVLMCSINEAMGRVTAEAMAACRPVIGLGRAGTVELVEHERTGLLYRGGPEALAASMVRVIEDPCLAAGLCETAWSIARRRFTTETYARRVHDVLEAVSTQ